jgi:hypothetical protein
MKLLSRTTRGSSAPPVSLTSASVRLTTITNPPTIRPRRRQPLRNARLGSPFDFNPIQRPATPSTVTTISMSAEVHGPGALARGGPPPPRPTCAQYWLRSSSESELEHLINTLRSPQDLKALIDLGRRSGNSNLLTRCHTILVQNLITGLGLRRAEDVEALRSLELGGLCAHADGYGFWNMSSLPLGQQQGGMDVDMADGYATPPHQILWRQ